MPLRGHVVMVTDLYHVTTLNNPTKQPSAVRFQRLGCVYVEWKQKQKTLNDFNNVDNIQPDQT